MLHLNACCVLSSGNLEKSRSSHGKMKITIKLELESGTTNVRNKNVFGTNGLMKNMARIQKNHKMKTIYLLAKKELNFHFLEPAI